MASLPPTLRKLEELLALVEEYSPIIYSSSERGTEIGRRIPVLYGEVEEVYRKIAGDQSVTVRNGPRGSTFRNYFESGFLSGSTLHLHEGMQELRRVIGGVRGQIATSEADTRPSSDPIGQAWTLLHPRVQVVAQERFEAGQHADAVEATLKELAVTVRHLVVQRGGQELDGVALMHTAFSPNNPVIVLADLSTKSGKDMQRGYMDLFAGAMSAIRNPKAHGNVTISPERAMHLLFLASTLWYTLDERP